MKLKLRHFRHKILLLGLIALVLISGAGTGVYFLATSNRVPNIASNNIYTSAETLCVHVSSDSKCNSTQAQNNSLTNATTNKSVTNQNVQSNASYCPLSDGSLAINKSGSSCSVLDQGECWAYTSTVNNALLTAIKNLTNTTLQQTQKLMSIGDYNTSDLNQLVDTGNTDIHNLYEAYLQKFNPPYPNCNPLTQTQAYTPIQQF